MTTIVATPDLPPAPLGERAAPSNASAADRETFGALVDDSVAALTNDDAVARDADSAPNGDETEDAPARTDDTSRDVEAAAAAAAAATDAMHATAPVLALPAAASAGDTDGDASVVDAVTTSAAAAALTEAGVAGASAPMLVAPTTAAPPDAVVADEAHRDAPPPPAADGIVDVDGDLDGAGADGGVRDVGVGTELLATAGPSATDAPVPPGATPATPAPIAAPAAPPADVASDAAATDPAMSDPAGDAAPWAQVARAVRGVRHHADGSHTMTVRLDPPELGAVRIELRSHDGQLSIHASADVLATRDTLARALPELRAALEASGLDTGTIDVDARGAKQHDGHGAKQHDGHGAKQHGAEHRGDDLGPTPRAGRGGADAIPGLAPGPADAAVHGESTSRLDLRL